MEGGRESSPSALRAGKSCGGGRDGSQAHSEPGRVVAAKRIQGAGRSGGGGQEGSHTQSEPGGVVEGGGKGRQAHSEPGRVVEGYITMTSSQ